MAGAAVMVVVIAGALLGIGAQRTLVDTEDDAIQPAADVHQPPADVATDVGPADDTPSQPASRARAPAQLNTSDRGSRVTITEGASDGGSSDGGAKETNNADGESNRGGSEAGEDAGGGRDEPNNP